MKIHQNFTSFIAWWRHQMETFAALLALGARNSPVTVEFPSQRPVTRSFDVFFDLRLNKRLSKQSWGWWFETPSRPLWRHYNGRRGDQGLVVVVLAWYSRNIMFSALGRSTINISENHADYIWYTYKLLFLLPPEALLLFASSYNRNTQFEESSTQKML